MTKLWFIVLCLALAAISVIRCDSDSSSSSDSNGSEGDSGVEDSAACSAIAQYLSGDVTAPADQSQLLSSFFDDFDFDIIAFTVYNLPKLIVTNEFSFDIQILRGNFENFRNFIASSDVESILGDFSTAFEGVVEAAGMISEADDIDRPMIRQNVEQLLSDFLDAIEPCELDRYNRKIRNLFKIDIFGQLVASVECVVGEAAVPGLVAAANATQGIRPDILEINDAFIKIIPFAIARNYIRVLIELFIRPLFYPFESIEDAAETVNELFMMTLNTEDLCGVNPVDAVVEIFDPLFNVQALNFVIETQGLDLEA